MEHLDRKALIQGALYGYHAISSITHSYEDGTTTVTVKSYVDEAAFGDGAANAHWTDVELPLDEGLTAALAAEAVGADPRFAEYDDSTNAGLVEELAGLLTDEQAATVPQAYPEWEPNMSYETGKRLQYGGGLYRVLQPHTSQETWTPTAAPSLYAEILPGQGGDEPSGTYPEWVQPDSTNPFMKGDRVAHNGKDWESDYDNNVWEPGVFGWSEI